MLIQLKIKNFTIIESLEIDYAAGMTVLTGETGAGKSIIIDALNLALGMRAENKIVRKGHDKCEITAIFAIENIPQAQKWLQQQDLSNDNECILRRTIYLNGRSQAYVNGQALPLNIVKQLSQYLITIHGQHENQFLLKRDYQRKLIDAYAQNETLCDQVAKLYQNWRLKNNELAALIQPSDNEKARRELLRYQLDELLELNLTENEVDTLHAEHKQLHQAQDIIKHSQTALAILNDPDSNSINDLLLQINHEIKQCPNTDNITTLLDNARIHLQEAEEEIRAYSQQLEINPQRLAQIETRLQNIHQIARKHHIDAAQLTQIETKLKQMLANAKQNEQRIEQLQQDILQIKQDYQKLSGQLSTKRRQAALQLSIEIKKNLKKLAFAQSDFYIEFITEEKNMLYEHGMERIEFRISANPGQTPQPLHHIASGGELSRIALAIDVITVKSLAIATVIFDEIDTGIGGAQAKIVGQLLKKLGKNTQVFSVTHLPQVASSADHHCKVIKKIINNETQTKVLPLNNRERIKEIARMLGGIKITPQSLAQAELLLAE